MFLEPDRPVWDRQALVRARKEYSCVECHKAIEKKTLHWYIAWCAWSAFLWRNTVTAVRICQECKNDWEELMSSTQLECYTYGFIADAIHEEVAGEELSANHRLVEKWVPNLFTAA